MLQSATRTFSLFTLFMGYALGLRAQTPSPATLHGVMSRWEIANIQVSEQYSITPNLKNQSLAAYINQLERQGVNTAIINVQPSVYYEPASVSFWQQWQQ